ncbi:caspase family protein [Candidatus Sumerlaeota bacterium]|nr:caspase family protein [Candidatus Sumerlaeota bacterium]
MNLRPLITTLAALAAATPIAAADAPFIEPGHVVSGELSATDDQFNGGFFADAYLFEGQAGETIHVTLESREIDCHVYLVAPSGQTFDNDDDPHGGTLNSLLQVTLPETGIYSIWASSYAGGETGVYALEWNRGTWPSLTGREYHGIFVGITDYSLSGSNSLPHCAEDAIRLAGVFVDRGIMVPDNVTVLTDSQATVANVRSAFARVAARADDDDVFLFFHSGHGSMTASEGDVEAMDEMICLVDGDMTDDEMRALFDSIPTEIQVLALDSCMSGGFANDVIAGARGRVGLFACEADRTSSVASELGAGGYLSHHLIQAIAGLADRDGDKRITVDELCHFLHVQSAAQVLQWDLQGLMGDDLQHLVVAREDVSGGDILFAPRQS